MRMNFSHCEQSKKPSKPWEEKRKKKRVKGSKRGVRKRAIKTDRATNDREKKKKKDQEQRGSVVPALHSQGPAASRVVAARRSLNTVRALLGVPQPRCRR